MKNKAKDKLRNICSYCNYSWVDNVLNSSLIEECPKCGDKNISREELLSYYQDEELEKESVDYTGYDDDDNFFGH